MTILFIKKAETPAGTFDTAEVLQKFLEAKDVDEIKPYVERAKDRLYVSWASVEGRDKDGQRIPIDDVIEEQDKLMRRNAPISDMHTNRHVGQTLAYKVLQHPVTGTLGVLHLNKIWSGDIANPVDDQVWKETQLGIRQGSSVGGINESKSYTQEKDGRMTEVLEGFHHYETANVYRGANPWAYNEAVSIVAKSASQVAGDDKFFEAVWSTLEKNSTGGVTKTTLLSAFNQAYANNSALNAAEVLFKAEENQPSLCAESIIKTDHAEVVGDPMTPEEIQKNYDSFTKSVDEKLNVLSSSVSKTSEALSEIAKTLAELKKSAVVKEEAAGEVPGETPAKLPETPAPQTSNESEVYKAQNEELKKALAEAQNVAKAAVSEVKKFSTPRPGASAPAQEKAQDIKKMALDLATGKVRGNWNTVHKAMAEVMPPSPASLVMQTRAVSQ